MFPELTPEAIQAQNESMEPLYQRSFLPDRTVNWDLAWVFYGEGMKITKDKPEFRGVEWRGPLPRSWSLPPLTEPEVHIYYQHFLPVLVPMSPALRGTFFFTPPTLSSLASAATDAMRRRDLSSRNEARRQREAEDVLWMAEARLREAVRAHASLLDHLRRSLFALWKLEPRVDHDALWECWVRAFGIVSHGYEHPANACMAQAAHYAAEPTEDTVRRLRAATSSPDHSIERYTDTVDMICKLLELRDESVQRGNRALADVSVARDLQSRNWKGVPWKDVKPLDLLPFPFNLLHSASKQNDRLSLTAGLLATTLLHHGFFDEVADRWATMSGDAYKTSLRSAFIRNDRPSGDTCDYTPTDPFTCSRALGPYLHSSKCDRGMSALELFDAMADKWSGTVGQQTGESLRKRWSEVVSMGRLELPMRQLQKLHARTAESVGLEVPDASLYHPSASSQTTRASDFLLAAQAVALWMDRERGEPESAGDWLRLPE